MKNQYCFLSKPFVIGDVKVIPSLRQISVNGGRITELSQRQMQGVLELAENYGEVVARGKMHEILCLSEEGLRDPGALSHHVGAIRKAFDDSAKHPKYIKTVRGLGYCLLQEPKPLPDEQNIGIALQSDEAVSEIDYVALQKRAVPFQSQSFAAATTFSVAAIVLISFVITKSTWSTTSSRQPLMSEHSISQANTREYNQDKSISVSTDTNTGTNTGTMDIEENLSANYQQYLKSLSYTQLRKQHLLIVENADASGRRKSAQLWMVGKEYFRFSAWQASDKALNESIDIQRGLGAQKDPLQLSQALTSLAQVRSLVAQNIDSSRELLLEAKSLLSEHSVNTAESAEILSTHAALLRFSDDYLGAEALLRESIKIAQSITPTPTEKLVRFNTQLVNILGHLGQFTEATALVNRLLGAETTRLGADSIHTVPVMSEYADLLAKSGNHLAAIEVYSRSVVIMQKSVASTHPRLRHIKLALAKVLVESNDFNQASAQYRDIIEAEEMLKNKSPLRLSNLKLGLSEALIGAQKPEQAYKEALEAVSLIDQQQEPVPAWLRYTADSVHGAALIEIGECGAGTQLIQSAVNQMFRDGESDPRISSRIHERKSYYEDIGPCA